MRPVRLKIWIKSKPVLQGKVYQLDGKWIFLANIDDNKLWHNYNGYSIANQILEAFSTLKVRPLILYKHKKRGLIYMSVPSDFYKHGIQVEYGKHRQMVLPVKHWKFFHKKLKEPFGLPSMDIDSWMKEKKQEPDYSGVSMDGYLKSMNKLGEIFRSKYAV